MAISVDTPSSSHLHSQGSISERGGEENASVVVETAQSSRELVQECTFAQRDQNTSMLKSCELPVNAEPESAHASGLQASTQKDAEIVETPECSSSGDSLVWKVEDSEAPKVPEGFTMVAESKFPITSFFLIMLLILSSHSAKNVETKFAVLFLSSDFQCSSWRLHEQTGHSRDVSFQHPIKIFIGARFGSCKEVQKYCVYSNSHLIIETLQEVNDVPYGDYFRVEGLWDVERNNEINNGCILRVYTNVAFSKITMLKGKIIQSAVEESREVLAIWIEHAHELLKQKHLGQRALSRSTRLAVDNRADLEKSATDRCSEASLEGNDLGISGESSSPTALEQQVPKSLQDESSASTTKFFTSLRGQSKVVGLLIVIVAMILILMQMSILVLLSRPQQINVINHPSNMYKESGVYSPAYLDKQINNIKGKMIMVESSLGKIQKEHAILIFFLNELELYRKEKR